MPMISIVSDVFILASKILSALIKEICEPVSSKNTSYLSDIDVNRTKNISLLKRTNFDFVYLLESATGFA